METLMNSSSSSSSSRSPLSTSPLGPKSSSSSGRRRRRTRRSGRENDPTLHPNIVTGQSLSKHRVHHGRSELEEDGDDPGRSSQLPPSRSPVKVVVRIRPVNRREREGVRIVHNLSADTLSMDGRRCVFDSVLGPDSSQEDVFRSVGVPLVRDALAGYNTSIISYGQTGSGKTYTMWGPPSAMLDCHSINSYQGIVPRIFHLLFSEIQKEQVNSEDKKINYQCRCSFLEIHSEQINDLLDPTQRNLQMGNDARNGFHVENLSDEYVATVEDVIQILVKGLANRKVGATSMNSKSSRSHIIFTCTIESWCKGSSSKCFSSSKTCRISLVDLAGWDLEKVSGVSRHNINESKRIKRSLSRLGKVVNVLAKIAYSGKVQEIPYRDSCLTHLLQDTVGGNSKTTFVCCISPNDRHKAGTLSTLRFGERAKLIQNKAVINEITEDHVNGLSVQIRILKEELIKEKSYGSDSSETSGAYFKGKNARDSLNLLRLSLNRSLILHHVDNDSEEELDVDEDDATELCSQLSNLRSSFEGKPKSIKESESSMSILPSQVNSTAKIENSIVSHVDGSDNELTVDSFQGETILDDVHSVIPDTEIPNTVTVVPPLIETCPPNHDALNSAIDTPRKSSCSILPSLKLPLLDDPTVCLSPKLDNNLKKSIITSSSLSASKSPSESLVSNLERQYTRKCDPVCSSMQSSKICPTESLAASLRRGLEIIDHHQQNSATRRSLIGLSFEHLASVSCQSVHKVEAGSQTSLHEANTLLCSACKKELDVNASSRFSHNLCMQIVAADKEVTPERSLKDDNRALAHTVKSKLELETLCAEQAAMIRSLNCLVHQYKHELGQTSAREKVEFDTNFLLKHSADCVMPIEECKSEGNMAVAVGRAASEENNPEETWKKTHDTTTLDMKEKEELVKEIQNLKSQLRSFTENISTDGSLLDQIRNGSCSPSDYEKERQRWTESESRWISLTEELRIDLESNRRLAEKKDVELSLEKKCTAELDDALRRSIVGHARIIEHYAELQEQHNDLLGRHRKVMEGIAEVKKAVSKAGSKGRAKAFAAALTAEMSALQIERERERAFLKEQNKGLRIQLRDTAEAVHAAGELLVRLREAEEAVSLAEKKHGQAEQENEKLRKQVEKMKKKHAMEMVTMKHYLAESRLPKSALGPLYHHQQRGKDSEGAGEAEEEPRPTFPDDDQSWRAAFGPSYQ